MPLTIKDIERSGRTIRDIAEERGILLWQCRRELFNFAQPLDSESREELVSLYPEDTAKQAAKRYRTTENQVHAAWKGSKKFVQLDPELALHMYIECDNIRDAARLLSVSTPTLITCLQKQGIEIEVQQRHRHNALQVEKRKRAILYDIQNTTDDMTTIAERYGVDVSVVSRINLNKRAYRYIEDKDKEQAIALLKQIPNLSEVARQTGISRATLYKYKRQIENETEN